MALTIDTELHPQVPVIALGQLRAKLVSVTFDSSYPAGGESFTPANVGMSEFLFVLPRMDANGDAEFIVEYDYTAQKLMVFGVEQDADAATTDALDELDDTSASVDGKVARVLVIGF